jgi:hypothetical protein
LHYWIKFTSQKNVQPQTIIFILILISVQYNWYYSLMITHNMEDINSKIVVIVSDNFITRMLMNEVDFISFKICKISAIKNWWEPQNLQSKYSLSGIRHLTFQMKASYRYDTTISVSTMANKAMHEQKHHHVRI